jgi:hypothetical protein
VKERSAKIELFFTYMQGAIDGIWLFSKGSCAGILVPSVGDDMKF